MFEGLQKKWKVSGKRLFFILLIFALAGSLTGYIGRRAMAALGVEPTLLYLLFYLILITLIWPLAVLAVSLPFGQFPFFRSYLARLFGRFPARRTAKRLIVFASGTGSNAQKIIDHFRNTKVKVVQIVSNRADAGIAEIARREGLPFLVIERERFFRGDAYLPELDAQADLIVLAGFLWKMPEALIHAFPRQIVNIHPALLPRYGGKGMYGANVHTAVIGAGEVESGITIHYVDEQYDHGAVIFQAACPVLPDDTPDTLARRIHTLEHLHFPIVIEKLLNGERP